MFMCRHVLVQGCSVHGWLVGGVHGLLVRVMFMPTHWLHGSRWLVGCWFMFGWIRLVHVHGSWWIIVVSSLGGVLFVFE
jgi:hypothetical protein